MSDGRDMQDNKELDGWPWKAMEWGRKGMELSRYRTDTAISVGPLDRYKTFSLYGFRNNKIEMWIGFEGDGMQGAKV